MSDMDILSFISSVSGPEAPAPTEKPPTETEPKTPAKPFEKPERCPSGPRPKPDGDEEYETCRVVSGLNADDWKPEGL